MGNSSKDWILSNRGLILTTSFQHYSRKRENPTGRTWEPKEIERESTQVKDPGISHHFPDQVGRKQSPDGRRDREMKIHTGLDRFPEQLIKD